MSVVRSDWVQELYLKQYVKEITRGDKSGTTKKGNKNSREGDRKTSKEL